MSHMAMECGYNAVADLGRDPRVPWIPLSVYSYVALVQLLASYLSVFVAILVV